MKELDEIGEKMAERMHHVTHAELMAVQRKWAPIFKAAAKPGWGIGMKY